MTGSVDTLGTEVITERPNAIVGLLTLRGAPVIRWEQQHVNNTPGRLTLSIFAPGAPTTGVPTQNVVVNMVGDSAKLTLSANGRCQSAQQRGACRQRTHVTRV